MPILKAEGLVKSYKGRTVVNGVSFEIKPGEIVGLLGKNGAGKTTSFYMVVGLVKPEKGRVLLDDRDITKLPMYERARLGIGYLAQEPSAFRKLTAAENIMLVLEMQPQMTPQFRKDRVEEILTSLGLQARRNSQAQVLSGGERRRVEIARVLATKPAFILLDEPFTGVDPIAIEDLQGIVRDLKSQGIGVLITDQNAQVTLELTDRAYIVSDGTIQTQGTAHELSIDPIARKYYLGENTASSIQATAKYRAARLAAAEDESEAS